MTFTQPFADYEILARVGSGAMGTVFKARERAIRRRGAYRGYGGHHAATAAEPPHVDFIRLFGCITLNL